jgi:hypothetical protein
MMHFKINGQDVRPTWKAKLLITTVLVIGGILLFVFASAFLAIAAVAGAVLLIYSLIRGAAPGRGRSEFTTIRMEDYPPRPPTPERLRTKKEDDVIDV